MRGVWVYEGFRGGWANEVFGGRGRTSDLTQLPCDPKPLVLFSLTVICSAGPNLAGPS